MITLELATLSPTDFKHLQHVGWSNDAGFDIKIIEPSLQKFFEKAGVSKEKLKDDSAKKFVCDFLERHGFAEEIKKFENPCSPGAQTISSQQSPAKPQRLASPQPPAPPQPPALPQRPPPAPLPRHPPTPLPRNKKKTSMQLDHHTFD